MSINLTAKIWPLIVLISLSGLASCAIDNKLVIKNKGIVSNTFYINAVEVVFPAASEVEFIPLHGSSWLLSGDLATIEKNVIDGLNLRSDAVPPNIKDSQIQVEKVSIKYSDSIMDGSDTYPSLSLSILVKQTRNEIVIGACYVPAVYSELDQPVSHGLFAGRTKMRSMVLPAYEELIAKALTEALVNGFKCLSEKTKLPAG